MFHLNAALLALGAYLLGSVPFGLLLARAIGGVDPRSAGSGNIGATNVARTAGKAAGILTLLLDAAKGAAPPLIGEHVLGLPTWAVTAAALAAVLGHVFPIYLRFRGGKGVATAAGAFLALSPLATLVAVGVFGVAFAIGRVVSVGSLLGCLSLVGSTVWFDRRPPVIALACVVAVLVFVRHRGNIRRLFRGDEPGLGNSSSG